MEVTFSGLPYTCYHTSWGHFWPQDNTRVKLEENIQGGVVHFEERHVADHKVNQTISKVADRQIKEEEMIVNHKQDKIVTRKPLVTQIPPQRHTSVHRRIILCNLYVWVKCPAAWRQIHPFSFPLSVFLHNTWQLYQLTVNRTPIHPFLSFILLLRCLVHTIYQVFILHRTLSY